MKDKIISPPPSSHSNFHFFYLSHKKLQAIVSTQMKSIGVSVICANCLVYHKQPITCRGRSLKRINSSSWSISVSARMRRVSCGIVLSSKVVEVELAVKEMWTGLINWSQWPLSPLFPSAGTRKKRPVSMALKIKVLPAIWTLSCNLSTGLPIFERPLMKFPLIMMSLKRVSRLHCNAYSSICNILTDLLVRMGVILPFEHSQIFVQHHSPASLPPPYFLERNYWTDKVFWMGYSRLFYATRYSRIQSGLARQSRKEDEGYKSRGCHFQAFRRQE